jgi:hypothetical protein
MHATVRDIETISLLFLFTVRMRANNNNVRHSMFTSRYSATGLVICVRGRSCVLEVDDVCL